MALKHSKNIPNMSKNCSSDKMESSWINDLNINAFLWCSKSTVRSCKNLKVKKEEFNDVRQDLAVLSIINFICNGILYDTFFSFTKTLLFCWNYNCREWEIAQLNFLFWCRSQKKSMIMITLFWNHFVRFAKSFF